MKNTQYPKVVKIENEKLKKLLKEKSALIIVGRAKSQEIENIEKEMAETNDLLMAEEKKVNLDEFKEREKEISARMDACIADINQVKADVFAKIKAETPQELRDKYEALEKQKEDLEIERNKVALKATKYNDKIIPLSRKLLKEYLDDEYSDYESIQLVDDEITAVIFSHLDEFKENFTKRRKV